MNVKRFSITRYKVPVTVVRDEPGRYAITTDRDTYVIVRAPWYSSDKWLIERQSDLKPMGDATLRGCALLVAWGYL